MCKVKKKIISIVIVYMFVSTNIIYSPGIRACCDEDEWLILKFHLNLSKEYCIDDIELDEESTLSVITAIGEYFASIDSSYKDADLGLWQVFEIRGIDNLRYFTIKDPFIFHELHNVVLDKENGKYYLLDGINKKQLNSFLPYKDLKLKSEYDILRYARFICLLKYPNRIVKFISSINELLFAAVYNEVTAYDLENIEKYSNIPVEMPSISKDGDKITVKQYMTKDENIVLNKIIIKIGKILDVQDKEIGRIPRWYSIIDY